MPLQIHPLSVMPGAIRVRKKHKYFAKKTQNSIDIAIILL